MAKDALISGHGLNQAVLTLLSTLGRPELLKRRSEIDPIHRATVSRADLFARQVQSLLNELGPAELSIGLLDGIQSGLIHTNNEISEFISNGNAAHLANASSSLDGAIASASQAFFKKSPKGAKVYGESIASVERAALSAIESISQKTSALEGAISQSESRVSEQIRANEEARERLNASVIEAQNATNKARQKLESLEEKLNSAQDERLKALSSNFDTEVSRKKDEANQVIMRLEQLESNAKNIVQIIGNIGVTGNYQLRSESETSQANFWRWVTVFIFSVGISLIVYNLLHSIGGSVDLSTLLTRFAIAISIAIPALYTARESARHRTNADRAKQVELELASLSPFLETLTDDDRDKIILQLTPKYFGSLPNDHKIENPVDLTRVIEKLADSLVKKVPQ